MSYISRRLRRGKKPQLTHEEILEMLNDTWDVDSQCKLLPLYTKGDSNNVEEFWEEKN